MDRVEDDASDGSGMDRDMKVSTVISRIPRADCSFNVLLVQSRLRMRCISGTETEDARMRKEA